MVSVGLEFEFVGLALVAGGEFLQSLAGPLDGLLSVRKLEKRNEKQFRNVPLLVGLLFQFLLLVGLHLSLLHLQVAVLVEHALLELEVRVGELADLLLSSERSTSLETLASESGLKSLLLSKELLLSSETRLKAWLSNETLLLSSESGLEALGGDLSGLKGRLSKVVGSNVDESRVVNDVRATSLLAEGRLLGKSVAKRRLAVEREGTLL